MRQTNEAGIDLIKQWEGLRLKAYYDTGRVLTIGYGHTSAGGPPPVVQGMQITEAEADQILRADLAVSESVIERLVTVPLNDNQHGALVSFVLNIGEPQFKGSTLLRKLNKDQYEAVPGELAKWVNDNGKRIEGLVNRRAAEAGLWVKGAFVSSSPVPVQKAKEKILTPEVIGVGTSIATGLGSKLIEGNGPVQWAFAAVMVASALTALGFFIKSRMADA